MKTYSTNYLANEFQIDRAHAVRALRGVSPDAEETKDRPTYSIATFHKALELHRLANSSNANDGGDDGDSATSGLTQARVRVTLANAETKERANLVASGLLVSKDEVARVFQNMTSIIRETLLSMPGKLADRTAGEQDRTACFEIIHREVISCLTILSTPESYRPSGLAEPRTDDATVGNA